jgi:hypothetical protein
MNYGESYDLAIKVWNENILLSKSEFLEVKMQILFYLIDSGLKLGFVTDDLENWIVEMERLKSYDFRTLF